jgi:hypothetical protein
MADQNELRRFYHLKSNPFSSRVQIDTPMAGRSEEQKTWDDILTNKAGARGCSLNFIIGDYGMGKTHALYHIKRDCDDRDGMMSVIVKLLPEDEVKNFGMDFVRRIFKNLDVSVRKILASLKKPRATSAFPEHVKIIQKYAADDAVAARILTGGKVSARELTEAKIHTSMGNTETALEFLAVLLSMLHDAQIKSMVLCIDEAEYVFSQMTSRKAALVFNAMRAMYDLPESPNLGLGLQPVANIIFFFAISTAGMDKLTKMEKVEQHQGGPIQPLLTRIERKISLARLTANETKNLVEAYLKTSRTTGEKLSSPLIPYTKDFIDYLFELTKGHPRSIIERCDYVIVAGIKDHIKEITKQYAREVFTKLHLPTA